MKVDYLNYPRLLYRNLHDLKFPYVYFWSWVPFGASVFTIAVSSGWTAPFLCKQWPSYLFQFWLDVSRTLSDIRMAPPADFYLLFCASQHLSSAFRLWVWGVFLSDDRQLGRSFSPVNLNLYIHELMSFTFKANTERSLLIPVILLFFWWVGLLSVLFCFPS